MNIADAFEPIPPDTDRGAGVLVLDPMFIPVLKSLDRVVSPEPRDVMVRLPFVVVEIVASAPPPRFKRVESIDNVAAASIDVNPVAERIVSDAAIVNVLSPESRVRVDPVDPSVPAPTNVRESISRTVPSTVTLPAFASSSIVIEPVPAATSNSVKLIAVAPPLIAVREVPLSVVVPTRFAIVELTLSVEPAPPLRGDILIVPVVSPPRVRV